MAVDLPELVDTPEITAARERLQAAWREQTEANQRAEAAREDLVAALKARFAANLAAHGGGTMSFELLAQLGLPCIDHAGVVGFPDSSHEIHIEAGETYATCGWGNL